MDNIVTLRPVIESDLPIFFEQQNDPAAHVTAASQVRDHDGFMEHWEKILSSETIRIMTIVYGNEIAGNILSFDLDGKREVGYWLGRGFWGKGIASRALGEYLHIELIRPLYGYAAKHNIGSHRVLEKCGFESAGEDAIFRIFVLK